MHVAPEFTTAGPTPVDAVTQLFTAQRAQLVLSALLVLNNLADAEDAVADTFSRLLDRADRLPAGPALLPYVWKSVLNRSRTVARRRRRHEPLSEHDRFLVDAPDEQVAKYHEYRAVLAAVRKLPRQQMAVLVLRYWHGASIDETATALGISAGSVKTHGHRAQQSVKKHLEVNGYGPLD